MKIEKEKNTISTNVLLKLANARKLASFIKDITLPWKFVHERCKWYEIKEGCENK